MLNEVKLAKKKTKGNLRNLNGELESIPKEFLSISANNNDTGTTI